MTITILLTSTSTTFFWFHLKVKLQIVLQPKFITRLHDTKRCWWNTHAYNTLHYEIKITNMKMTMTITILLTSTSTTTTTWVSWTVFMRTITQTPNQPSIQIPHKFSYQNNLIPNLFKIIYMITTTTITIFLTSTSTTKLFVSSQSQTPNCPSTQIHHKTSWHKEMLMKHPCLQYITLRD